MSAKSYIQVLVPLRLDWEPYYYVPDGIKVQEGDRVKVLFSGREYVGVVCNTEVVQIPALKEEDILPVLERIDYLPSVTPAELRFWRTLSSYYLCTPGEVYKAVYGAEKKAPKKWKPGSHSPEIIEKELPDRLEKPYSAIKEAFTLKKTVLLDGSPASGGADIQFKLAADTLKNGKSVLFLVPEIAMSAGMEEPLSAAFPGLFIYNSSVSDVKKRDVLLEARSGSPMLVLGTRSALFIPFSNLGLIVVQQEQDSSYKQESPAPRYHAREASIMLASISGANVLLSSSTPSLESIYNAEIGLFERVKLNDCFNNSERPRTDIVDTVAETRKRGMSGSFSLVLLKEIKHTLDSGQKVLVVCRSKQVMDQTLEELNAIFPGTPGSAIECITPSGISHTCISSFGLVGVIQADGLLGKEDFRADEKALRLLRQLSAVRLVVQTREPSHPVFTSLAAGSDYSAAMLQERKAALYPPYTRYVKVSIKDTDSQRLNLRARILSNRIREVLTQFSNPQILGPVESQDPQTREIHIMLRRDRNLSPGKNALYKEVSAFQAQYSCAGHITLDVDPQ